VVAQTVAVSAAAVSASTPVSVSMVASSSSAPVAVLERSPRGSLPEQVPIPAQDAQPEQAAAALMAPKRQRARVAEAAQQSDAASARSVQAPA